ncbi:MAG: CRISPR-associated helicase Cas3', partial [Anaerolineales bacterium]|nr:CRISPR-associated helicase Cas3' [Anaerolineales bacterium]
QIHPLICHMIDVAQVTLTIWNQILSPAARAHLSNPLQLDDHDAGHLIAFCAGLHDLGKASPAFQRKYQPSVTKLEQGGLVFPKVYINKPFAHGTASAEFLPNHLEEMIGCSRQSGNKIGQVVGGHHGCWPHPADQNKLTSSDLGDEQWADIRDELVKTLYELVQPPSIENLKGSKPEQNAFFTLFSGLVSIADWIGSMERFFPFVQAPIDENTYWKQAASQAQNALDTLNWTQWQPPTNPILFENLFHFSPRGAQKTIIDLVHRLEYPALVIIEAPTGVGKTEAALYLADQWACNNQQRGLYVAMPTMATSNQMFSRVGRMLATRYPDDAIHPMLIHSQARWMDDINNFGINTTDQVDDMTWFLPRKRSLLAPFGVGTVDQSFLSVLKAKHFFVRLFGLYHKTIIFDEVHAYDTYMSTLFQRLLSWLRLVGASVVILSATLPHATRRQLLTAYAGEGTAEPTEEIYPAVTWAADGKIGTIQIPDGDERILEIRWTGWEPECLVTLLSEELKDGGCAAVICNTISRAQQVYQALESAGIVTPDMLWLFHARFPMIWRDQIEKEVLSRFGKQGNRPERAIVVATQVIEQSLDLDFDFMITDMAPADLVLQRAGRLHRHQGRTRPQLVEQPRLFVTTPQYNSQGIPDFGVDTFIYSEYILLRSFLALSQYSQLALPADTTDLIEAVYSDNEAEGIEINMAEALKQAKIDMDRRQVEHETKALGNLIPDSGESRFMYVGQTLLEEDSPEIHQSLQALTRLIQPSVSVVCLHDTERGLCLGDDGIGPLINLDRKPDSGLTRQLVQHTVSISHRGVVKRLLEQPIPAGWQRHTLLRTHRAAIFIDGVCTIDGSPYSLRLSRTMGLEIIKQQEE